MGDKCGIILDPKLEQFNTPYNIYHYPKSIQIVKFLNRGVPLAQLDRASVF